MYICEDRNEKEQLEGIYKENEKKSQVNNDFDALMRNNNEYDKSCNILPTPKAESIFVKILNWLKNFFKNK